MDPADPFVTVPNILNGPQIKWRWEVVAVNSHFELGILCNIQREKIIFMLLSALLIEFANLQILLWTL